MDPHRRRNALTGEWVLVSPQRTQRPWQGQIETPPAVKRLAYEPTCYLCPGNTRGTGERNPQYTGTLVFINDFPALDPGPTVGIESSELLTTRAVRGTCRVVCYSPRHDLTLADMTPAEIRRVIDLWATQTEELGSSYQWVQVFENKGELMGASNPHPHGQTWGMDTIPHLPTLEDREQRAYLQTHGTALLRDYAANERKDGTRVIIESEHWLVVVPFWAVWPFETLVLPNRHVGQMPQLNDTERDDLAAVLKRLLTTYDKLFGVPFPYSMGWHGAPFTSDNHDHWQLHAHFYPPLLRSATVKKFMVGFEMLGEAQRDITAEFAAQRLREVDS